MGASACTALVHGLWLGRPSAWPMAQQLQQRGHQTRLFGYSSVYRSPGENSAVLARWARSIEAETVHWIGHSLGGLLLLRMLAEAGRELPPGRVVLLGSPIRGSGAARGSAGFLPFRWAMGRALEMLVDGYPELPPEREVAAFAGTASIGLGQAFAGLDKPHDGTVAVSETRVDGLALHRTFPVSHTGMMMSAPVANAVDRFLLSGVA
ncbi:MAG: alpha/beta hydrolase [Wenzhouxiangellaceae bacterium]|nr:alpha/beta hydrolase [Wenzhouxiangellaceae bacterium]